MTVKNFTQFIIKYPLFLLCFLPACINHHKQPSAGKQINLLELADRLSVVARQKMLLYADSVYSAQKVKTPYLKTGWLMAYSGYYSYKGAYEKSIGYVDSAIAIIDKQNLKDSIWTDYYFSANVHKAVTLYKTGHYSGAIDIYFRLKEFADMSENKGTMAYKLDNNIGLILYKQRKFEEATRYFKLAVTDMKYGKNDTYSINFKQQFLDNIGLCFINLGKVDSALAYYRKAFYTTIIDSDKFSRDAAQNTTMKLVARGVIMNNIAEAFIKQNKPDSAEILLKKNIAINAHMFNNEIRYAQLSKLTLANLYEQRKRYPEMRAQLADLRKSMDTAKNDAVELGWRKAMSDYAGKNIPVAEALRLENSYLKFKDSLNQVTLANAAADISSELSFKQQQIDIILLKNDNHISHLYLWITVTVSLIVLIMGALIYYYYRKSRKKNDALILLNNEVNEQNHKLEFATTELKKSNTDKERILRVVAHDLRDPIGGAASLVDSIINDDLPGEDAAQSLQVIEKSLTNSLTLINELLMLDLDNAQIVLHKAPAEINDTVKQCIVLMQLIAAKKNQQLKFSALPVPLTVHIDRKKIERVINNLVGNAIKFSPTSGQINIQLTRNDESLLITVADNGIGIPHEMQDELFTTMGNIRRAGTAGEKSFGLGLYVCKQIAEAHNGRVWVKSEPGEGTAFFVQLPLNSL